MSYNRCAYCSYHRKPSSLKKTSTVERTYMKIFYMKHWLRLIICSSIMSYGGFKCPLVHSRLQLQYRLSFATNLNGNCSILFMVVLNVSPASQLQCALPSFVRLPSSIHSCIVSSVFDKFKREITAN